MKVFQIRTRFTMFPVMVKPIIHNPNDYSSPEVCFDKVVTIKSKIESWDTSLYTVCSDKLQVLKEIIFYP